MNESEVRATSQISQHLLTRIQTNNQYGTHDLSAFILENLGLSRGERVLDVGCGAGHFTVQFAKRTKTPFSVTGIDLSNGSLEEARALAETQGVQAEFLCRNMDEAGDAFAPGHFDVITAVYSLYYSADAPKLLQDLQRLLKPSGRLVVVGPSGDNNAGWFQFLESFMALPERVTYTSSVFMDREVIPIAARYFATYERFDFVNHISLPTVEALRAYWTANVYYEPQYDEAFEKAAKAHFAQHGAFTFHKRALMVLMKGKQ